MLNKFIIAIIMIFSTQQNIFSNRNAKNHKELLEEHNKLYLEFNELLKTAMSNVNSAFQG